MGSLEVESLDVESPDTHRKLRLGSGQKAIDTWQGSPRQMESEPSTCRKGSLRHVEGEPKHADRAVDAWKGSPRHVEREP